MRLGASSQWVSKQGARMRGLSVVTARTCGAATNRLSTGGAVALQIDTEAYGRGSGMPRAGPQSVSGVTIRLCLPQAAGHHHVPVMPSPNAVPAWPGLVVSVKVHMMPEHRRFCHRDCGERSDCKRRHLSRSG
jgi:hypothetical protein